MPALMAVLLACAAISIGLLGACGESRTSASRGAHTSAAAAEDVEPSPVLDGDDETAVDFGHLADARAAGPVTAFVKTYLRLAAAGDSVRVCRLVARRQAARSDFPDTFILHEIPWRVIRGSCERYVAGLLRSQRVRLSEELARLAFERVRIGEEHDSGALAFLRFGSRIEYVFALQRMRHGWGAATLLPSILP